MREQGLADGESTGAGRQKETAVIQQSRKGAKRQGNSKVRAAERGKHPRNAENWGTIGQ